MQIHDLNTGTPASGHYLAMDSGTDTYKATPGNIKPAYTTGDSSTATSWTSVTAVATGLSFSTLINRITTMMKNVRYLYNVLGSSTFSTVASTITGAIGNTALGTTATTLSGAIAEHESDIVTINNKIDTASSYTVYAPTYCIVYKKSGVGFVYGISSGGLTLTGDNAWHSLTTISSGYRPYGDVYFAGATPSGQAISFKITTEGVLSYTTNANTSYWVYGISYPM